MRRQARLVVPVLALCALCLSSLSLTAQPDIQPPSPQDKKLELTIPAGKYINYVFSLDMPPTSRPLRVSIDGPQGYSTLLVPPGETVILPVAIGTKMLELKRAVTVRLSYPAMNVYAFGNTSEGQVPFRAE